VDEELAFHLEARVHELMGAGASRESARAQAHAEFGDTEGVTATLTAIGARIARRDRRAGWRGAVVQDLRYVIRALAAAPGFTFVTVATLALGIGANGALFRVIDPLFFRAPAGVRDAATVARLYVRTPPMTQPDGRSQSVTRFTHYPGFRAIAARMPAGSVTGYIARRSGLGRGEEPPKTGTAWIAPAYFSLLRVGPPVIGRYLTDEECSVPSTAHVAVISEQEWRSRYGGSATILGTSIEFDGVAFTIVGVAAAGFAGVDVDTVAYWVPIGTLPFPFQPPWYQERSSRSVQMLTRLAGPSGPIASAATAAFRTHAPTREQRFEVVTAPLLVSRGPLGATTEESISARLAIVALIVLGIACANAAGLQLARAVSRRREIAVRLALGMSRGRSVSLFFSESLVLSLAGGALSILVAWVGGAAARRTLLPDISWSGPTIDARLLTFAITASLLVAALTALPAVSSVARERLAPVLRSDGRGGGDPQSRLRSALLIAQVAFSVVLLVGAAAFIRSLRTVTSIDTGYEVDKLMTVSLRAEVGLLGRAHGAEILALLKSRLDMHPSVASVALVGVAPLSGYVSTDLFHRDGTAVPVERDRVPSYMTVTPGFFHTAGIAIERGRDFDARDSVGATPVVIVNRAMATLVWPGGSAIGQCVRMGTPTRPCLEVVAIAENTNRDGLLDSGGGRLPLYFVPQAQARGEFAEPAHALVRTADRTDAEAAAEIVRSAVRTALPAGVYATVTPLARSFDRQLRPWQLGTRLFTVFGLLALLVASIGIYTTMAFSVRRRTREMGIRIALGAAQASVARLVLGEGLRLVVAGLLIGSVAAVASGRLIQSLLYQTAPSDPTILGAATATMLIVAVAGCLAPAVRASRVDPSITLRAD
jgi:predicted permease